MNMSRRSNAVPPSHRAIDEAAEWLAEADDWELDLERRRKFGEWLRRSPENIAAYLEVTAFWSDLTHAAPPGGFDIAKLVTEARAESNVTALERVSVESPAAQPPQVKNRATYRWRRYGAAAVIVVTVGAAVLGIQYGRGEIYVTSIGEQRSVSLEDGSTVELNARTRVRVQMDAEKRSVLLEEGQALFTVAKDTTRPFVVASGNVKIRAVGTQFDVDRRSERTTVTVLEGVVAIGANPEVPDVKLPAGRRVVVRGEEAGPPEVVDVTAVTAWTDRRLVFQGTPLGEVVEDFNRFNRLPLVVEGPELAALAISGVYTSSDPSSLIRFLRAQPGIRVYETESHIRIARD